MLSVYSFEVSRNKTSAVSYGTAIQKSGAAPGNSRHSPIPLPPKMPSIPPPEMRDSIKSKVLGRGGVGLGGEEEAFLQKGSSSPPNLLPHLSPNLLPPRC